MTNRTSSRIVRAFTKAEANIKDGHPSFTVLTAAPCEKDSLTHYIVAVPRATMRNGLFGSISTAIFSVGGRPTKFGNDLHVHVNVIHGVELSLDNKTPHIVHVFVDHSKMALPKPPASFTESSRGLPEMVCLYLEQAILRNNTAGQWFAEWLRRII